MVAVPTSADANCGVYAIVFDNGKMYVGQASDIKKRWREHRNESAKNDGLVYRAMRRHSYEFRILCNCAREHLDAIEIDLIAQLKTMSPAGYNCKTGGANGVPSDETRQKISAANKGRKHGPRPPEVRAQISAAQKGKKRRPLTDEHKAALSAVKKGVPKPAWHREKIALGKLGKPLSPEHAAAISAGHQRRREQQNMEVSRGCSI